MARKRKRKSRRRQEGRKILELVPQYSIESGEDKPIFLSIGYSSCHWCTVMEGEAFSDRAIADYLNHYFLPIKVDREERPDIDSIYMQALQMMVGQGGWPLNVFLTPDSLIPFYGGTYFPVQPRFNRPGFLQVLQSVRRYYDEEKEKLSKFTAEMLGALRQSAILPRAETNLAAPYLLATGIETNTAVIRVNPNNYGRPSFPMIPYSHLALQGSRFGDDFDDSLRQAFNGRFSGQVVQFFLQPPCLETSEDEFFPLYSYNKYFCSVLFS